MDNKEKMEEALSKFLEFSNFVKDFAAEWDFKEGVNTLYYEELYKMKLTEAFLRGMLYRSNEEEESNDQEEGKETNADRINTTS